jgi:hypothetical protein
VTWTAEQIEQEVLRITGRGLLAAGAYLSGRLKEVLSVPAPRKYVGFGVKGSIGVDLQGKTWRATTKATPGAPPRKVSGSFRSKVTVRQPAQHHVQVGVFADVRAWPLETWMRHPYLVTTFQRERGNLQRIIGSEFGSRVGFE